MTAALTGSLLYEGGCLLFRDEETAGRLMPVWPDGSVFNGTTLIFHQPGKAEQLVVVGEEVMIEGQPAVPVAGPSGTGRCGAQPFFVSRVRPAN